MRPRARWDRKGRGPSRSCLVLGVPAAIGVIGALAVLVSSPASLAAQLALPSVRIPVRTGPCLVSAEPLVLPNGIEAYVEPEAVLPLDGDVVVLGGPTYEWRVSPPDTVRPVSESEHVGAYVAPPDGPLIPLPFEGIPGTVRAVRLADGAMGVLLDAVDPDSLATREFPVGVWYSAWRDGAWEAAEPVPVPEGARPSMYASSELVRTPEGVTWMASVRHRLDRWDVWRHERDRQGRWRSERVQDGLAESITMAYAPDTGLWMALVDEDPGIPGWQKSLRLYRHQDSWELVRRIDVIEPGLEIYEPKLLALPDGLTISWRVLEWDGLPAWARVGVTPASGGRLILLDPDAERVLPVAMPDGRPAWVVHHDDQRTGEQLLRVLRYDGEGAVSTVVELPHPFTGFFGATAVGPDEILVVGPQFDPDPTRAVVRSLVLRFDLSCV